MTGPGGSRRARAFLLLAMAALAVACAPAPEAVGRKLFDTHCTACHGRDAGGDGPLAEGLDRPVPDLTAIAARNGGDFPTARVMSVIDGYSRVRAGNIAMPEFGIELQEGPLVRYDAGDGVMTPTPSRLVALAEYLRSIQR